MNKRFIVILNSTTDQKNEEFLEWIQENKLGWWHWFQGSWLLATHNDSWTASKVREVIKERFDNTYNLVFELKEGEGTWAGYGPSGEENNMFTWLNDNWK